MKIVSQRRAAGMTQAELAEKCDTTQQQIAKIETGVVDPRLSTLRKISDALGCELSSLFFTRQEFVDAINDVVDSKIIELGKVELIDLNVICSEANGLPAFHPFWEKIKINKAKNKVSFKGEKK